MIKVEDAISNLKNQMLRFAEGTEPDLALKMAIKALTQKSIILDKIRAEINSPNRGTCDYFIVDRIEEIIDKYIEADKEADKEAADERHS